MIYSRRFHRFVDKKSQLVYQKFLLELLDIQVVGQKFKLVAFTHCGSQLGLWLDLPFGNFVKIVPWCHITKKKMVFIA